MPKYYCTFGVGQPNGGKVLPIKARNQAEARDYMFAHYGNEWCTSRTEVEWNDWKRFAAPRHIPIEEELPEANLFKEGE